MDARSVAARLPRATGFHAEVDRSGRGSKPTWPSCARSLCNEYYDAKGRHGDRDRLFVAVPSDLFGVHAAAVTNAAATIDCRIRVENLSPMPGLGYADAIVVPRHRREVRNDH